VIPTKVTDICVFLVCVSTLEEVENILVLMKELSTSFEFKVCFIEGPTFSGIGGVGTLKDKEQHTSGDA
jgi:hypothetical protein